MSFANLHSYEPTTKYHSTDESFLSDTLYLPMWSTSDRRYLRALSCSSIMAVMITVKLYYVISAPQARFSQLFQNSKGFQGNTSKLTLWNSLFLTFRYPILSSFYCTDRPQTDITPKLEKLWRWGSSYFKNVWNRYLLYSNRIYASFLQFVRAWTHMYLFLNIETSRPFLMMQFL